ncbi:collagen alpha-1(I) chain-like [Vulpes lagopus]|uniref:collagen alpha-1(I) chain-like n=1 Tax=Vulpes lagopus TaxID=494514 RepID=UPI001BC955C4|nr:collagen alpha-1(I) chain-like [Vulpes lagopus]
MAAAARRGRQRAGTRSRGTEAGRRARARTPPRHRGDARAAADGQRRAAAGDPTHARGTRAPGRGPRPAGMGGGGRRRRPLVTTQRHRRGGGRGQAADAGGKAAAGPGSAGAPGSAAPGRQDGRRTRTRAGADGKGRGRETPRRPGGQGAGERQAGAVEERTAGHREGASGSLRRCLGAQRRAPWGARGVPPPEASSARAVPRHPRTPARPPRRAPSNLAGLGGSNRHRSRDRFSRERSPAHTRATTPRPNTPARFPPPLPRRTESTSPGDAPPAMAGGGEQDTQQRRGRFPSPEGGVRGGTRGAPATLRSGDAGRRGAGGGGRVGGDGEEAHSVPGPGARGEGPVPGRARQRRREPGHRVNAHGIPPPPARGRSRDARDAGRPQHPWQTSPQTGPHTAGAQGTRDPRRGGPVRTSVRPSAGPSVRSSVRSNPESRPGEAPPGGSRPDPCAPAAPPPAVTPPGSGQGPGQTASQPAKPAARAAHTQTTRGGWRGGGRAAPPHPRPRAHSHTHAGNTPRTGRRPGPTVVNPASVATLHAQRRGSGWGLRYPKAPSRIAREGFLTEGASPPPLRPPKRAPPNGAPGPTGLAGRAQVFGKGQAQGNPERSRPVPPRGHHPPPRPSTARPRHRPEGRAPRLPRGGRDRGTETGARPVPGERGSPSGWPSARGAGSARRGRSRVPTKSSESHRPHTTPAGAARGRGGGRKMRRPGPRQGHGCASLADFHHPLLGRATDGGGGPRGVDGEGNDATARPQAPEATWSAPGAPRRAGRNALKRAHAGRRARDHHIDRQQAAAPRGLPEEQKPSEDGDRGDLLPPHRQPLDPQGAGATGQPQRQRGTPDTRHGALRDRGCHSQQPGAHGMERTGVKDPPPPAHTALPRVPETGG